MPLGERVILKAFVYKSDEIKADNELADAFEGILLSMIELNNPKAGLTTCFRKCCS